MIENNKLLSEMQNVENGNIVMSAEGAINMKTVGIATTTIEKLSSQNAFAKETVDTYDLENPVPVQTENPSGLENVNITLPNLNVMDTLTPSNEPVSNVVNPNMQMPQMPNDILAQEPSDINDNLFISKNLLDQANQEIAPAVPQMPEAPAEVAPVMPQMPEAPAEVAPVMPQMPEVPAGVAPAMPQMPETPAEVAPVMPQMPEAPISEEKTNSIDSDYIDFVNKKIEELKNQILSQIEDTKNEIIMYNKSNNYNSDITIDKSENVSAQSDSFPDLNAPTLDNQFNNMNSMEPTLVNPLLDGNLDNVIPNIDESPIQAEPGKFIQF